MNDVFTGTWTEAILSHVEVLYRQSRGAAEDILEYPQDT
jgi:hypothetical protein